MSSLSLPAWLRESAAQLAELEHKQEEAHLRLSELRASLVRFDEMMENRKTGTTTTTVTEAAAVSKEKDMRCELARRLPADLCMAVLVFCDGMDLVWGYARASASTAAWLDGLDDLWRKVSIRHGTDPFRAAVTEYVALIEKACFFVQYRASVAGRRETLESLEATALVSADKNPRVCRELHNRGAAAALLSLLSNELGAIQELAAASLANVVASCGLDAQLCPAARKALAALLTSPSARLNLHVAPGTSTSAYCQGMACKHASRALVNIFLPEFALAFPPDQQQLHACPFCFPNDLALEVYTYYASGSLKDRFLVTLTISSEHRISGTGRDDLGHFQLDGRIEKAESSSPALHFSKSYTPESHQQQHRSTRRRGGNVGLVLWAAVDVQADGFFGIWEVDYVDAHFELRRGGCCRAVPHARG